jgi:hypothetical protein
MTKAPLDELAEDVKLGCTSSEALSAAPIELRTQFKIK